MISIYVASSWRNEFQQGVVAALRGDGHRVYDFRGPGDGWGEEGTGPGGFAWSEVDPNWQSWPSDIPRYLEGLQHPRAIEGFNRDMDALKQSDVCVMVMPCGPSASMEMGWAAGSGRLTIVYIPGMREPDLMVKMADLVTSDLNRVRHTILCRDAVSPDQKASVEWYKKNGGRFDARLNLDRAASEFIELREAVASGDWDGASEELGDVKICLDVFAHSMATDILTEQRRKQRINDVREWEVTPDGCLKHIKGSDPRE